MTFSDVIALLFFLYEIFPILIQETSYLSYIYICETTIDLTFKRFENFYLPTLFPLALAPRARQQSQVLGVLSPVLVCVCVDLLFIHPSATRRASVCQTVRVYTHTHTNTEETHGRVSVRAHAQYILYLIYI